jgi:hypothetical protein
MEINAESRNARMTVSSRYTAEDASLYDPAGMEDNEESHPHIKDKAGIRALPHRPSAGQFGKELIVCHETFSEFLRLYGRGRDKLNVAEKPNDAHNRKKAAPCGRSAQPFAGTDC